MALKTLGTAANNTLAALVALDGSFSQADIATVRANIKNDVVNGNPIWPDAYRSGVLFIPNRGFLMVRAGDYIAYDSTGWPILLSATAAASAAWVHS